MRSTPSIIDLRADSKTTLEHHTHDIILKLSNKLHEAETKVIEGHSTSWLDLGSKISTTDAQLVKTNSIAITNNNILEAKIKVSALQLASILNLKPTLQDIEKRFFLVSSTLAPEYVSTVDKIAKKNIAEIVNVHYRNLGVKQHIEDISTSIQMKVKSRQTINSISYREIPVTILTIVLNISEKCGD